MWVTGRERETHPGESRPAVCCEEQRLCGAFCEAGSSREREGWKEGEKKEEEEEERRRITHRNRVINLVALTALCRVTGKVMFGS